MVERTGLETDPPLLLPGTRVGNYVVLDDWPTEGASRAYAAEHAVFGRRVVLVMKLPPRGPYRGTRSPDEIEEHYRRDFERWLRMLSRLNHPNILGVLDCGEIEGWPYAVLQHVEGRTLAQLQEERQEQDLLTLLRLFHAVARVLAYCHEQGVVHRDVKGRNIWIDNTGVPFLTGFLIATPYPALEEPYARGGTPPLVPPEAWETMDPRVSSPDARAYEPPVDIWPFGLELLETLTGSPAFSNPTPIRWRTATFDDMKAVREAIQSPNPVDLTGLSSSIPEPVVAFLARCVEKDAADRFQNGEDLERALDALIDHLEHSTGQRRQTAPIVGRNLLLFAEPVRSEEAGRYFEVHVEEHVGAGAFADVYRVTRLVERSTDEPEKAVRPLALKVLKPELVREDQTIQRFRREARFLARVSHRHVVSVRGFGRLGGTLYIILDYLEGPTLHGWMRSHAGLSVRRATRVVRDIARGLDAIHQAALVHRDLKPDNVIVVDEGKTAVIADFGLVHGADATRLTLTGAFCSTRS